MLTGRCLCERVRYEIDTALGAVVMCHCTACRRASGTAFASNASVPADSFRIVSGRKAIRKFKSSKGKYRAFCRKCGSPLFAIEKSHPEIVRIRLGTLDGAGDARPAAHIWTSSKSDWYQIAGNLKQFEQEAPAEYFAVADTVGAKGRKKS
jgi:hypothetical protein